MIYSLYVNIGGKINMKILRAIGAFFAKIGRWIANTAWVQPLLIVGGIFGIIFSIPYIKQGIEGLQADSTDYKYQYYQEHALSLKEGGRADKLLGYLEEYKDNVENIRKEFGSQFFLSFVQQNCQNCKDAVEGYKYFASHNKSGIKFRLYTILVDKTDSEGEYMAKAIVKNHLDLFDDIACMYGEDNDDYPLFRNKPSVKSGIVDKIQSLTKAADADGEGIETPTTFMIDLDNFEKGSYGVNGITQVFFNYIDFIEDTVNASTKGDMVRDIWTYQGLFDPDFED